MKIRAMEEKVKNKKKIQRSTESYNQSIFERDDLGERDDERVKRLGKGMSPVVGDSQSTLRIPD